MDRQAVLAIIAKRERQIAELDADPGSAVYGYEIERWFRVASLRSWQRLLAEIDGK